MSLHTTTLPWNETEVLSVDEVLPRLSRQLSANLLYHLPKSVSLYADTSIPPADIENLIELIADFLPQEFEIRESRRSRFESLGLFASEEMNAALTREHTQPWAIYYSAHGGLRLQDEHGDPLRVSAGIIPCSSMQNHGVGWRRTGNGATHVWLATARKDGEEWDLNSDIGHESAHAAFAPIPLFAQSIHIELDTISFVGTQHPSELTPNQLARMCYLFTELAVVIIRNEQRTTDTLLPIAHPDDLHAFLHLGAQIFPTYGFDSARDEYARDSGALDFDSSLAYKIGAASLRALGHCTSHITVGNIEGVSHLIFQTALNSPS
jgi:hypothetical protein